MRPQLNAHAPTETTLIYPAINHLIPKANYSSPKNHCTIVGFTLTVVNKFRRFLSQFSTNFHEILHTLFSIHVVATLKISFW